MDLPFWLIWLLLIFGGIVSLIIHIIIHEAGHLIGGWLSGYKFLSFRVLNFLWAKNEEGKIKFLVNQPINGIVGQCLMEPCEREEDFKFVLYNVAAGWANIIAALICLPLMNYQLLHSETAYLFVALFLFSVVGLLLGISNLRAKQTGGIPVDGLNVKTAKESDEAKYGFYLMLKYHAQMSKGVTYKDLEDVQLREVRDLRNYFTIYPLLLRASQLEERGDVQEAYDLLRKIPDDQLPKHYQAHILLQQFYLETVYFQDEASFDRARQTWEFLQHDKRMKHYLLSKIPSLMPYQVAKAAILDHDFTKAKNLLAENKKRLPRLGHAGSILATELMLERIEERMNELKVVNTAKKAG